MTPEYDIWWYPWVWHMMISLSMTYDDTPEYDIWWYPFKSLKLIGGNCGNILDYNIIIWRGFWKVIRWYISAKTVVLKT